MLTLIGFYILSFFVFLEALPVLKAATSSAKGLVARKKQTLPDEMHKKDEFFFNFCIDGKTLEKD
jgi:hypothetical protein